MYFQWHQACSYMNNELKQIYNECLLEGHMSLKRKQGAIFAIATAKWLKAQNWQSLKSSVLKLAFHARNCSKIGQENSSE